MTTKIQFDCDSLEEALVYMSAHQYYDLICDFTEAVRKARKHGTDKQVLEQVEHYFADFERARDFAQGAY